MKTKKCSFAECKRMGNKRIYRNSLAYQMGSLFSDKPLCEDHRDEVMVKWSTAEGYA